MEKRALFHRDFTLMVLGQVASLFGNSILRFALSLYVLDQTGSAAAFGGILAVSMIPTVLLSPFGGLLADRVSRKHIMVALDFTTAGLIAAFALLFIKGSSMAAVAVTMVLLSIIQSFYQPSVQASIPSLVKNEQLEKGNGIVVQVNALANLLGPILGGLLYGFLGIRPILLASGICFFLSAVMEVFLHIPYTKQPAVGGAFQVIKRDFSQALRFLTKENPQIFKLLGVLAALNLFLAAMMIVGLPYLVKIHLGLSSQHYGFAEGAMAVGSILGGLLCGLAARRFRFQNSYCFLLFAAVAMLPISAAALTVRAPLASYGVILLCVMLSMCCATLFNIFAQTYAQRQTPPHLLGKVTSFITVLSMCALPVGQALYGALFEKLHQYAAGVVLFACAASVWIALWAGHIQRKLPAEPINNSQ